MTDILIQRTISGRYKVGDVIENIDPESEYWVSHVLAGNAIVLDDIEFVDAREHASLSGSATTEEQIYYRFEEEE